MVTTEKGKGYWKEEYTKLHFADLQKYPFTETHFPSQPEKGLGIGTLRNERGEIVIDFRNLSGMFEEKYPTPFWFGAKGFAERWGLKPSQLEGGVVYVRTTYLTPEGINKFLEKKFLRENDPKCFTQWDLVALSPKEYDDLEETDETREKEREEQQSTEKDTTTSTPPLEPEQKSINDKLKDKLNLIKTLMDDERYEKHLFPESQLRSDDTPLIRKLKLLIVYRRSPSLGVLIREENVVKPEKHEFDSAKELLKQHKHKMLGHLELCFMENYRPPYDHSNLDYNILETGISAKHYNFNFSNIGGFAPSKNTINYFKPRTVTFKKDMNMKTKFDNKRNKEKYEDIIDDYSKSTPRYLLDYLNVNSDCYEFNEEYSPKDFISLGLKSKKMQWDTYPKLIKKDDNDSNFIWLTFSKLLKPQLKTGLEVRKFFGIIRLSGKEMEILSKKWSSLRETTAEIDPEEIIKILDFDSSYEASKKD